MLSFAETSSDLDSDLSLTLSVASFSDLSFDMSSASDLSSYSDLSSFNDLSSEVSSLETSMESTFSMVVTGVL